MNRRSGAVRSALLPVFMLAAVFICGCIKNRTVVQVNKDGSGKIVVTRVFSKETVEMTNAQMAEMKKQMESRASFGMDMARNTPKDPFFNEKAIKKDAKKYGPLVKFVKARKIDSGGSQGYVAVYSFKDVNDVFLNMEKMGEDLSRGGMQMDYYSGREDSESEDEDSGQTVERGENVIEFKLVKGEPAKLQVSLPEMPADSDISDVDEYLDGGDSDAADKDKDKEAEEEGADEYMEDMMMSQYSYGYGGFGGGMMPAMFIGVGNEKEAAKRMYKGMEFTLAVEVEGTVVKAGASHVDPANKNRFFLIDVNANKIMASPKGSKMIEKSGRYAFGGSSMSSLTKLPGAAIETNRQVVIEFK